ncbi:MAG: chemotaxis protein CheV [Magnetococcales bacterium]|nr:chemotaxis protein CheV [Magnetococcales bacterium]
MDQMMEEVDRRANLAFSNQMEMLTFFLADNQQYGINVFKIIEVIETPRNVVVMPNSHKAIVGAIDFRGKAVTVIDLGCGLGLAPVDYRNSLSYIIVCEYSGTTQGLMVTSPNKLLNKSWGDVQRPGSGIQSSGYLTALTYEENGEAVQILDIEKLLGEIIGVDNEIEESLLKQGQGMNLKGVFRVLVIDDSKAAQKLLTSTLDKLGVEYDVFDGAQPAFDRLESSLTDEGSIYSLIVSDIEMPGMDGFTFTRKVKQHADPRVSSVHLVLHSSMSNQSNKVKAQEIGADDFIPKYDPNAIAGLILSKMAALV